MRFGLFGKLDSQLELIIKLAINYSNSIIALIAQFIKRGYLLNLIEI